MRIKKGSSKKIKKRGTGRWVTTSSMVVHQNKWFKVAQDDVITPYGDPQQHFFLRSSPAVMVIALTHQFRFPMVTTFRRGTRKHLWELPGGGLDGEGRKRPTRKRALAMAKQELWEETGYKAQHWVLLSTIYPLPGMSDKKTYVFLATGLQQTNGHKREEDGLGPMQEFSFAEAKHLMAKGRVREATTGFTIAMAEAKVAEGLSVSDSPPSKPRVRRARKKK